MKIRTAICLALSAALSTGCSLVVDAEANQCESTSDCISKGGQLAQSVCSPDKVCVPLLTDECLFLAPEGVAIDDDTLVVGFMSPIVGEFASNGLPQWQGVQLALDEFRTGANGLPLPGGSTRGIAVVGCHDFEDSVGVAKHLVHNVGVPAILGPAFSGDTLKVATGVTVPAGALLFPSSATAAAITNLNDKGLVWRTCPSDAIQAIPLAGLVSEMEAKVRADKNLTSTTQIKVAITVKKDTYGTGLADAVIPLLRFNQNKTAAQNGGNLVRKDYDDPAENPQYDFLPLVTEIIQYNPQIVIAIGTNESVTDVMQRIETNWPSGSLDRPIYLFADGGRLPELVTAAADSSLRGRVLGTAPGRKTDNYDQWAVNFKGFHGQPPLTYADTAYDSAYLLAFAIGSLGNARVTGAGLAEGLKKTVGGTKLLPGPTSLNLGFSKLFDGESIDYEGISGPLDFDVTTGEAPADIDIWCIQPGGGAIVASGEYFDAELGSVQGTRTACEPGLNTPPPN